MFDKIGTHVLSDLGSVLARNSIPALTDDKLLRLISSNICGCHSNTQNIVIRLKGYTVIFICSCLQNKESPPNM